MGIVISYPMDKLMILNICSYFMGRGLKGKTLMNFMSALRTDHINRGIQCEALEDKFLKAVIKAVIKGVVNTDSLVETDPEQVIDTKMMRTIETI